MSKRSREETDDQPKQSKEERRAAKKLKRQEAENAQEESVKAEVPQLDEDDAAAEKAARKAARKAAKAASNSEEVTKIDDVAMEDAEKAARKAARKAAKAEKLATQQQSTQTDNNAVSQNNSSKQRLNGSDSTYQEDANLSALPQSEIDEFLSKSQITVIDETDNSQALRPITLFKYLNLGRKELETVLSDYKSPTPIQAAAWPYLLSGRDTIGVAETGSGKTIAFGLPCVQHVAAKQTPSKAIRACIVSPTRELALQIHEQITKICQPLHLKATCVYGGVDKNAQRQTLTGASIIVATPGRLNDFIEEGSISLSSVTYLVLDEADRMLDKGFEPEVRKIVAATSAQDGKRQTLMFTATWPPTVRDLAATFMNSPVRIMIGDNATGELRANVRIEQKVEVMDPYDKSERLIQVLKQYNAGKEDRILIFCLYKKEAVRVEEFVRNKGFKVVSIHGDLNQQKRQDSLEMFKLGKVKLMIATDVAARGLDIPAVKLVINHTFPLTADDYVHRIGR